MRYVRIHGGPDGESHFEDLCAETQQVEIAATAVFGVNETQSASNVFLPQLPPDCSDDFHPPPVRYLVAILRGEFETTITDGGVRRFKAGDVALLDDVGSRGHKSVVIGQSNVGFIFVQLAQ